ncbi:MAG: ATP-binding protein [Bacteroidota bacterium]
MRSLTLKLVLAFTILLAVQAILVALLVRDATRTSLDKYIQEDALQVFITDVTSHYQAEGSWNGIEKSLRIRQPRPQPGGRGRPPQRKRDGKQGPPPPPPGGRNGGKAGPTLHFGLLDASGMVIIGNQQWRKGVVLSNEDMGKYMPLLIDGEEVGAILLPSSKIPLSAEAQSLLGNLDASLIYALFAALSIALLLGFWFARTSLKPVKELTEASKAVAAGKHPTALQVHSQDEIGVLTASFNHMNDELSRARQVRKNMTADIAHELRTPLTVLTGYLEAMRDGDLQPSDERLGTLLEEAQHLQRLVDDLRLLSLADAGELPLVKTKTNPVDFAQSVVAMFENEAASNSVALSLEAPSNPISINADAGRLQQVLQNLVSNAMRFVPSGGAINIDISQSSQHTTFRVHDTGPGIPADDLPFVFERFYKADKSRQNHLESTGLGLAISRSIVAAHGGTIDVVSTEGEGTTFILTLPNDAN